MSDRQPAHLSVEELTRQANAYLETNDLRQAYPYVCRLAKPQEADPQVCVTAGLMALTLNKKDEAAEHFRHALHNESNNFEAAYNLALLDVADGNLDEAAGILQTLTELQPENAGLHNDLAIVWIDKGDRHRALQSFEKALNLDPNFSKARENAVQFALKNRLFAEGSHLLKTNAGHPQVSDSSRADIKRCHHSIDQAAGGRPGLPVEEPERQLTTHLVGGRLQGQKIAFFASQQTFIADTIRRLSEQNKTRLFGGGSVSEMHDLLEWADIAWFEWCDALIIEATRQPKRCPIVCRLHSYEVFTDMPRKVDWSKVDRLIFVNESVREIFRRQVRANVAATVIPNGVDIQRFEVSDHKRYGKKIASVGYINYKKNPALLLYCFKKIHAYDPEYSLHVAGQHQDPRIQVYFEHFLRENPLPIYFHGWVDDMPGWYADKDFVMSTSLFESFHYSVAEGMVSGLMPLIHNWYGAGSLYPEQFLFNDPDECLNLLKRLETSDRHRLAGENRRFIVERYNDKDIHERIVKELALVADRYRGEPSAVKGVSV